MKVLYRHINSFETFVDHLFSKNKTNVESLSCGSKFVALVITMGLLVSLRYKLRIVGVTIDVRSNVFCQNKSVTKTFILPQSVLNKNHNVICYHIVRESQSKYIITFG